MITALYKSIHLLTYLPTYLPTAFARSSKLMVGSQYGTWSTACQSQTLEFPSRKAITGVQTSPNVDIS